MSARVLFTALLFAALTAFGGTYAQAQTAPRGYTLECAPVRKVSKGHVLFDCALRPTHSASVGATRIFGDWRYGEAMPRALFTQVVGNGGPAVCAGINITCSNGIISLNTGGTLGVSLPLCTNSSALITTTGCASGGGDTITSPNATLTVGGTSSATTLDIALAHANAWTATQTNTGGWQAVGAGGANACSGTKYPTSNGNEFCAGGGDGALYGLVMGALNVDFNCASTCTVGDSKHIIWYDSLATGVTNACEQYYNKTPSSMYFSCSVQSLMHLVIGNATCSGTGTFTGQASSGGGACLVTLSAGTATWTFQQSFANTPVCVASDQTAANAVKVVPSTTSVTLTGTSSDVLGVICIGNGKP